MHVGFWGWERRFGGGGSYGGGEVDVERFDMDTRRAEVPCPIPTLVTNAVLLAANVTST